MNRTLRMTALGALVLVAGCAGNTSNGRIGGEAIPFLQPIQADAVQVDGWRLSTLTVIVPEDLTISTNPNVQFPREQIVWWGDPGGDRRAQVEDIMTRAIRSATDTLDGSVPVDITVKVNLFHAVTPKARNGAFFAWHDVSFGVDVRDAGTGALLASAEKIDADLEALRRGEARAAEERGLTQRVRISDRVARVMRDWLASSGATLTQPAPVYRIAMTPAIAQGRVAQR